MLKNENIEIQEDALSQLESELRLVLEELEPLLEKTVVGDKTTETVPQDMEIVSALFEKLLPMLKANDSDCDMYLDELRAVAGTEELAEQIETYDLRKAYKTLKNLMEKWGITYE